MKLCPRARARSPIERNDLNILRANQESNDRIANPAKRTLLDTPDAFVAKTEIKRR